MVSVSAISAINSITMHKYSLPNRRLQGVLTILFFIALLAIEFNKPLRFNAHFLTSKLTNKFSGRKTAADYGRYYSSHTSPLSLFSLALSLIHAEKAISAGVNFIPPIYHLSLNTLSQHSIHRYATTTTAYVQTLPVF